MNILLFFKKNKKEILIIHRLHTSIFAIILTIIGYRMVGEVVSSMVIINSLIFGAITSNIMIFNDIIDKDKDLLKGKKFIFEHYVLVLKYWIVFTAGIVISLSIFSMISTKVFVFCLVVWLLGVLYSYMQKIYILQNIIVALCSASPILCGTINKNNIYLNIILTFSSIFLIILSREILGDMRHKESDNGYKDTIPIRTEKKYPEQVLYLGLASTSAVLPKHVVEKIDLVLKGEFLESHKIINSLIIFSLVLLCPVINWFVFLPLIFLSMASVCTFIALLEKQCVEYWMKKASTFYTLGILSLFFILFFIRPSL